MKKTEIINILKENDLSEVEILKSGEDFLFANFYYDFDKDVLDAAKAYSNEESNLEEGSKEWYSKFYFPYLYDFANDEVLEVIEEIIEDFDVEGEIMAVQMTEKTSEYVQFMTLFTLEDTDVSIEELVKEFMS